MAKWSLGKKVNLKGCKLMYIQFNIKKIKHTWNFIKPSCLWSVQKHFHRSMRPHCWWNNISLVINLLQMRCRQFIVSIASEIERMSSCKRITLKIWGLDHEALHEVKFKYEIECPMAVEHVTMSIVEPSSGILLIYFAVILFQRSPVLIFLNQFSVKVQEVELDSTILAGAEHVETF